MSKITVQLKHEDGLHRQEADGTECSPEVALIAFETILLVKEDLRRLNSELADRVELYKFTWYQGYWRFLFVIKLPYPCDKIELLVEITGNHVRTSGHEIPNVHANWSYGTFWDHRKPRDVADMILPALAYAVDLEARHVESGVAIIDRLRTGLPTTGPVLAE